MKLIVSSVTTIHTTKHWTLPMRTIAGEKTLKSEWSGRVIRYLENAMVPHGKG